ncbi:hypothetical protein O3P69_014693 [Scylla paramamosain]|uniref:Uncharacterized protein n=1 Tax=Scylla paramamosain TaxID=85552 RepID=A0AAW0TYG1_SCYPA
MVESHMGRTEELSPWPRSNRLLSTPPSSSMAKRWPYSQRWRLWACTLYLQDNQRIFNALLVSLITTNQIQGCDLIQRSLSTHS